MEQIGKKKKTENEIQLDLFEDAPENKTTQHVEGEFQQDYLDDHEKGKEVDVTHLTSDDFIELEIKEPIIHKAISEEINRQIELQQEQNEIDEIEKATEAKEKAEEEEQRRIELRESIFKALEKENEDAINERDDSTGGYRHTAEIAQQKKEEEIKKQGKLNINKTKSKKSWWRRGGDPIRDILDRDNLR